MLEKFSGFDIKVLEVGALVYRELYSFMGVYSGPKIGYPLQVWQGSLILQGIALLSCFIYIYIYVNRNLGKGSCHHSILSIQSMEELRFTASLSFGFSNYFSKKIEEKTFLNTPHIQGLAVNYMTCRNLSIFQEIEKTHRPLADGRD